MITVYPFAELGHADYGWLDTRHHFSFSHYYDPGRMGFGPLRVINDDLIKAGAGFDAHPHRDMEIITYVRKGAITHHDSRSNKGRTVSGDVQVMSAGTGIFHSEYNLESEDTRIFQIWIEPNRLGVEPRWDSKAFPKEAVVDTLPLLVSGDGAAPLAINQNARLFGGKLRQDTHLTHRLAAQTYVLASEGQISLNGKILQEGDGAEIMHEVAVEIAAKTDAEVIAIEVPEQEA